MTTDPFGSASNDSLVSETAVDTGQTELILTPEQFDRLDNKVVRRMAAKLNSSDVNGKSPRLITRSAIAVQRTLNEYADE